MSTTISRLRNWSNRIAHRDRGGVSARRLAPCTRRRRSTSSGASPTDGSTPRASATAGPSRRCGSAGAEAAGAGAEDGDGARRGWSGTWILRLGCRRSLPPRWGRRGRATCRDDDLVRGILPFAVVRTEISVLCYVFTTWGSAGKQLDELTDRVCRLQRMAQRPVQRQHVAVPAPHPLAGQVPAGLEVVEDHLGRPLRDPDQRARGPAGEGPGRGRGTRARGRGCSGTSNPSSPRPPTRSRAPSDSDQSWSRSQAMSSLRPSSPVSQMTGAPATFTVSTRAAGSQLP